MPLSSVAEATLGQLLRLLALFRRQDCVDLSAGLSHNRVEPRLNLLPNSTNLLQLAIHERIDPHPLLRRKTKLLGEVIPYGAFPFRRTSARSPAEIMEMRPGRRAQDEPVEHHGSQPACQGNEEQDQGSDDATARRNRGCHQRLTGS
jgi:hypothetical protein